MSAASDDGEDPLALPEEDNEVLIVRQNVHQYDHPRPQPETRSRPSR